MVDQILRKSMEELREVQEDNYYKAEYNRHPHMCIRHPAEIRLHDRKLAVLLLLIFVIHRMKST